MPFMQPLSAKFCMLVKDGCSMTKENATTALGTFVEKIGEDYAQFFQETINFLVQYLGEFAGPEYKQFRGQAIETITIIATAVGLDQFRQVAGNVIAIML